jgi:alpha-amylase
MGDEEHPDGLAVVLSNGGEGKKRLEVGKERAGEKWTDILGWKQGEVVIGEDGWAGESSPFSDLFRWEWASIKTDHHFAFSRL